MNLKNLSAGLLLASFAGLSGAQPATVLPQSGPANAAARATAAKYAAQPHLAYIRTGSAVSDEASLRGLVALRERLNDLTEIKLGPVTAIDIERDDIALFPMIYWPISKTSPVLSEQAQRKVQKYMQMTPAHLIIFDVRDAGGLGATVPMVKRALGDVQLRPIVTMAPDHALTKTFFKLTELRGTFNYKTVKVEEPGPTGSEIVSSVVIGENNWAGAWAGMTLSKGSPDQEMAIRAGINLALLAMTGNYKLDQALILSKPPEGPAKK